MIVNKLKEIKSDADRNKGLFDVKQINQFISKNCPQVSSISPSKLDIENEP